MAWRRTRRGASLFVSGGEYPMPARDARRLAAAQGIDGGLYDSLSQAGRDAVFELYSAGHYVLVLPDGNGA